VDRLLDEAEAAVARREWEAVRQSCLDALVLDPENADARALQAAAERALAPSWARAAASASTWRATPASTATWRWRSSRRKD